MREAADVVVAGGGLVGAAAALVAARHGLSVVLLDRAEPRVRRGALGFDTRTVALNPSSAELLSELGVFDALAKEAFTRVYVWEEHGTRHIEFDASEVNRRELGWIVEVSPTVDALWGALRREPQIEVCVGAEVSGVASDGDAVVVRAGEQSIRASLLIAADGGESAVRALLGVDTERFATGQSAIATIVQTEKHHAHTAAQCFLHSGPIALLPLPSGSGLASDLSGSGLARDPDHFVSVVWSQRDADAKARLALDDAAFAREVERATESRLGRVLAVDARASFPLTQSLAQRFQPLPRVLLVGDAARVLHPLAGQGVNLGFEDVRGIRDIIRDAGRAALADGEVWRALARRRRVRGEIMVRAMDAFRALYASSDPTLQWLRNVGVDLVNRTPLVKVELMREALGLR